jgi:EAL domain-containing protein (putative c-di-GMP-specific phosphodiesterase class I)
VRFRIDHRRTSLVERDTVVGLGCDLLQGYLLGRPAEAADIGAPPAAPQNRGREDAERR